MTTLTAAEFIELLEHAQMDKDSESKRRRIPTGPWDPVDLENPEDTILEVVDSVDLRARMLPKSVYVYGVRFRGRVDLRDMTIQGSADFTACLFEEDFRLDGARILGSMSLARISAGRLTLNGVNVSGRFDLSGSRAASPIEFRGAKIGGALDLRGLSTRTVTLSGTRVGDDLRLGCGIEGRGHTSHIGTVDGTGVHIGGSVIISGAGSGQRRTKAEWPVAAEDQSANELSWDSDDLQKLNGPDLDFARAHINGNFTVEPFIANPDPQPWKESYPPIEQDAEIVWSAVNNVLLSGATIQGDLLFAGARARDLVASGAKISGDLWICVAETDIRKTVGTAARQSDLDSIVIQGAEIKGRAFLRGTRIRRDVDLSNTRIAGYFLFDRHKCYVTGPLEHAAATTIDGSLFLYQAQLRSPLEMKGVKIGKDLAMWSLESAAYIRVGQRSDDTERCEIGGGLDLHGARLTQLELNGVLVRGRVRIINLQCASLFIRPCRLINPHDRQVSSTQGYDPSDAIVFPQFGHLAMKNSKITAELQLILLQVSGKEFDGDRGLIIEDCKIDGGLLMFNATAISALYYEEYPSLREALKHSAIDHRAFGTAVVGGIRIKRTNVAGKLDMRCVKVDGPINMEDSDCGGEVDIAPVSYLDERPNRTTCHSFNLRMTRCSNNVDLSGLTVFDPDHIESGGSIDARFLQVSGDLIGTSSEGCAMIARSLDLSNAKLTRLVIEAGMFPVSMGGRAIQRGNHDGLILERADIGNFEVNLGTDRAAENAPSTYPDPMQLADISVGVWKIDGPERNSSDASKYIDLLKTDRPYRRSTYSSLEDRLRKSGEEDRADALYRAMCARDWKETKKDWAEARKNASVLDWASLIPQGLFLLFVRVPTHYLYGVFLRFGTNPLPLGILVFLMFVTSLPVYRTPVNFEPSRSATSETSKTSVPPPAIPQNWTYWDAIQVGLKNHVPMIDWAVRTKWEPKESGVTTFSLSGSAYCQNGGNRPFLTRCLYMPPEDYWNVMKLLNWLCWPLLLTFIIRKLMRNTN